MSWFFPGSLGERQCGRHLGNIHHQELGASSSSSSHTVQAKGNWPLRPNKALLGPRFHAQGLCQLCGQLLLILLRSDKSLVPHLTPPYRDVGHLHSKGQCPLHTPDRDQTLCFTKIHLWLRKVENRTSGLNVTGRQSRYCHLCGIFRLCRASFHNFHYWSWRQWQIGIFWKD